MNGTFKGKGVGEGSDFVFLAGFVVSGQEGKGDTSVCSLGGFWIQVWILGRPF